MFDIGNIEDNTIDLKRAVSTLEFLNNVFETKLEEEYTDVTNEYRNMFNELRNFKLISQLLQEHMKNICANYQNQIDEYYENPTLDSM